MNKIQLSILCGAALAAANAAHALQLSVSTPVRIGGDVSDVSCDLIDESGPHMAIDPSNPYHLAVVYSLGDMANPSPDSSDLTGERLIQSTAQIVAHTFDGGRTWSRAALPRQTLCTPDENGTAGENGTVGDPFIAMNSCGKVVTTGGWVSWEPLPSATHSDLRLFVSHSTDGGRTFSTPVEPETTINPQGNQRAPLMFDRQDPNRVWVMWERLHYLNEGPLPLGNFLYGIGGSIGIAQSSDAGATFPLALTAYTVRPGEEMATIGLLPSGNNFVLIVSVIEDTELVPYLLHQGPAPQQHLRAVQWNPAVAAPTASDMYADVGTIADGGTNGIPYAAAAPNGTLYVTWSDGDRGIFVARSVDGGLTWTGKDAPAITPAGRAFQPAIAARCDGSVGIFYYQYTPGTEIVTPHLAVSPNGLTNWTNTAIAQPFDLHLLTGGSNDGLTPGPGAYQDIVALPDGFGISVTLGNQLNVPAGQEQVFYIKVRVRR